MLRKNWKMASLITSPWHRARWLWRSTGVNVLKDRLGCAPTWLEEAQSM